MTTTLADREFGGALALTFVASVIASEAVRRFAQWRSLLDTPNARSLHATPTPRLGGVGIVLTTTGFASLCAASTGSWTLLAVACVLATVGLRDDIRPLSSGLRMAVQVLGAVVFLWREGLPSLVIAPGLVVPLPAAVVAMVLIVWIVGVLNITNFMDGMDGLAGSQTVAAASALAILQGGSGAGRLLLVLAASVLGFLAHNYPPARIFLGDAGSYFIGTILATATVHGMIATIPMATSALAFAPFLLDGSFTILRRARRGEKVWQAHRSHLYQRAAQAGRTHREVLVVYLTWIGTCACAAVFAGDSARVLAGGWSVAVIGLGLVWRWVGRLESDRAKPA